MHRNTLFCLTLFLTVATSACIAENTTVASSDFTYTISPNIPTHVTFADKKISLDRTDMYERYDRELSALTYTHGTTLLTLKRANRYFPMLVPILKKNNVPEDIIYLACIESNLNIRAYSPAKAAGLWQFIPSTAKAYGLEVNEYVDERYDPELSTEAACRYLKKAFRQYGNWESVAASYNAGTGRITKELESQNQSSAYDLYLVDETSRYMFRLLAMKEVMEHPLDYGFVLRADQFYNPVQYTYVEVNNPVESWVDWAAKHDLSFAQLREHNPWIRAKSLPNKTGKTYRVRIPKKTDLYRSSATKNIYDRRWIAD